MVLEASRICSRHGFKRDADPLRSCQATEQSDPCFEEFWLGGADALLLFVTLSRIASVSTVNRGTKICQNDRAESTAN